MQIIRGEISQSEIVLSDSELSARISRPATRLDEDVRRALGELFEVASIKFVATRVNILNIDGDTVELEGFSVKSSALSRYFSKCRETFMFMITLGSEVDRLIMKKRALSLSEGFFYNGVASALIEAACDSAEKKICANEKTVTRFSPGYADCPLSVQQYFMSLLMADKYVGIKLLDSMLMAPVKSVSAFIGVLN